MSGQGRPGADPFDARNLTLAIVATRWHEAIIEALLASALRTASECQVEEPTVLRVAGALELPVVVQCLASTHDAVVALGVVIRGGTPHFDYVCSAATLGLTEVSVRTGVPVGFGLLTCDDEAQALDRAGLAGSGEDKGHEAATAAVATAVLLARFWPGIGSAGA